MSLRLSHATWDALDPYAIAEFWRQLLDWSITEADTYKPGSDECYLTSPHGYTVLFYRVPDAKTVKTRAHMDLAPTCLMSSRDTWHVSWLQSTSQRIYLAIT